MIDVFLIGHGFMDSADTITLPVPLQIYVKENKMLDGRKTHAVVDSGPGHYQITNVNDEERKEVLGGVSLNEHYLCSDMASYSDINHTEKWKKRGKDSRQVVTAGILFKLPGDTCLFFTERSQARRLSGIVTCLATALHPASWQVHWTACRSSISGDDDKAKLSAINGGDLVDATSLT